MKPTFLGSPTSIRLTGQPIPGALDRHIGIAGFDQEKYSSSHVLLIGAGGLGSNIARTVVRKGVGRLTIIDPDTVEPSNLNRQHFHFEDIGVYKAVALVRNLQRECTASTVMAGFAVSLQEAIEHDLDLSCDVAACGVDNNPARVVASRYFRRCGIPIVFLAVSADADHGYVFVQETIGPPIVSLFPDMASETRYPCPDSPAIGDILQVVSGLASYAVDSLIMLRPRVWNYRHVYLSDGSLDGSSLVPIHRTACSESTEGLQSSP